MVSRFSPSNTGIMHLGNTRTAVVSYIMAKQTGGEFLLRIEDTDQVRSTAEWTTNITDTLNWLGIHSDRPIEYQMENHASGRYEATAKDLVSRGLAYYCKCSVTELKAMKTHQILSKSRIGYDSTCRERGNTSGVLRLDIKAIAEHYSLQRVPIDDRVLGHRHEDYRNLPDPVLMRADGTPTYLMANTVDDAFSGVNLITRGSDLYSQTATQVLFYHALIGKASAYAHLPLMYNEFKNKLSKRSPDTKGILQYKAEGYLPDAVIQFSLSLGNHSIPTNKAYSFAEMIGMYDLAKTNNKATSFVEHKIAYINRLHIRAMDDEKLSAILKDDYDILVQPEIVALFKYRADTLVELAENIKFTIGALKTHKDALSTLVMENFTKDKCRDFRSVVFGGRQTPPVDALAKLIA